MSDPASDQSSNGGLGQPGSLSSEASEPNNIAQGRRSYCDSPLQDKVSLQFAARPYPVGRAHFEGPPMEASDTFPPGASYASSIRGNLSGSRQPFSPKIILQWISTAGISYTEKIKQWFKNAIDAKKKIQKKEAENKIQMARGEAKKSKSDCLTLECDLCEKSFGSEDEFKEHYGSKEHLSKVPFKCTFCKTSFQEEIELRKHCDSEEHLAKVKEKSANKTYGDLCGKENEKETSFDHMRQLILSKFLGPPNYETTYQEEARANSPPPNQLSAATTNEEEWYFPNQPSSPATTELIGGGSFDEFCAKIVYTPPPNGEEMKRLDMEKKEAAITTELPEEIRKLKAENIDLRVKVDQLKETNMKLSEQLNRIKKETSPSYLQNMVVELMKIKKEMGFNLETKSFYRLMYVVSENYSSVWELVASMMICCGTITRPSGNYGERQPKRERDDDEGERAPKKRKKD